MRTLDYGRSRYTPWVQRGEYALGLLAGSLRNWKKKLATLLAVAIVLAALLVLLVAWLDWLQRPRKIAVIPGPSSADRPLELWYGRRGDLTLARWGGPSVTLLDYYGELTVAQVNWPADDRVVMTMSDGSTLQFAIGWRGTAPTTQPRSR